MSDPDNVDYLQPDFDPWTLTVPRLRSILVTHNIQYPATAKKSQLIDIFQEQLVPQAKKILTQRARAKRTSRGIFDADTPSASSADEQPNRYEYRDDEDGGVHAAALPTPAQSMRRSRSPRKAARSHKLDSEELTRNEMPEMEAPPPPRNRESPRKTRASRSVSAQPQEPPVLQQPPMMNGDTEMSGARTARPSSRRLPPTVKLEPQDEDDFFKHTPETKKIFTDDNPFQSGGSSPPAPVFTPSTRKSTGSVMTKPKASGSTRRRTDGPFADDQSGHSRRSLSKTFEYTVDRAPYTKSPEPDLLEPSEEFTPEEQLELMVEEAANPQLAIATRPKARGVNLKRPIFVLMTILLGAYAAWYRQEKIAVGFCGLGRSYRDVRIADLVPSKYAAHVPESLELPEWATVLVEPSCEPCPQHAICYEDFSLRCESGFLEKPHPMSFNGLVPLPSTCEPDGEKARRVQAVADRAVEELRDRRAKYECHEPIRADDEESIPDTPIVEEQELKETISQKRSKRMSAEDFDDLWASAIGEVKARDEVEVKTEETTNGEIEDFPVIRLSSTSLARLPLACSLRRQARLGLARYRSPLALTVLVAVFGAYLRARFRANRAAAARVPALVDTVLERLAAQKEIAFESDGGDGTSEDAFLFLPNLRDDVLRGTHSLAARENIWRRVRSVVEQNSNVRVGQRESSVSGEVGLAWEWIGPTSGGAIEGVTGSGGAARRRKSGRMSYGSELKGVAANQGDSPEAEAADSTRAGLHKKWEEGGRPFY